MSNPKDRHPQPGSTVASAARTKESQCRERFVGVVIGVGATARAVVERNRAVHRVAAVQRVPPPLQIESRENPFLSSSSSTVWSTVAAKPFYIGRDCRLPANIYLMLEVRRF